MILTKINFDTSNITLTFHFTKFLEKMEENLHVNLHVKGVDINFVE